MMLSSKGSVGACTPTGISAFLLCAFTAHHDNVVHDFDAEGLTREHQLAREQPIFLAGRWRT
jgi:hypothetical protein